MGTQPDSWTAPNFGLCLLWPNGWMDQDATWHGRRPRPRPHCVRWRPSSPPQKEEHGITQFSAHVLWPNGWMDQDATWYGGSPRPRPHCVRWGPNPSPRRQTDRQTDGEKVVKNDLLVPQSEYGPPQTSPCISLRSTAKITSGRKRIFIVHGS